MKKVIFGLLFAVTFQLGIASAPNWTQQLESKIEWMKVSNSGILVFSNNQGLHGVDPESQKVVWELAEVKNPIKQSYRAIPNTSLAVIEGNNSKVTQIEMSNFSTATFYIVDTYKGKVVFNSKSSNLRKVTDTHILPELGGILIECVNENKMAAYALIDINSGEIIWQHETEKVKTFTTKVPNLLAYTAVPRVSKDGQILATKNGNLYKLDAKTGDLIWKKEEVGGTFFTDKLGTTIFTVKSKGMTGGKIEVFAFRLDDGAEAWEEEIVIKAAYRSTIPREQDIIVITDEGFYIFDYKDGKAKYKKAPKAAGINDFRQIDEGFLVSFSNSIWLFDKETGKPAWKKPINAAGKDETVTFLKETSNGWLYISPTLSNIFDVKTGEKKIKKDLKLKKNPNSFYDEKNDKYIIYTKKTLFEISPKDLNYKVLTEELDFEGKEFPQTMEVRDDGYFFYSSQNAALITFDGRITYLNYYKAPDMGTGAKIGAYALGATAMLAHSASGGVTTALMDEMVATYNQVGQYTEAGTYSGSSEVLNEGFEALTKRYKSSKQTKDHHLILTTIVEGDEKYVGLVQLNKDSGKVDQEIKLEDKKPVYEIDEVTNTLYYADGNELKVWSL